MNSKSSENKNHKIQAESTRSGSSVIHSAKRGRFKLRRQSLSVEEFKNKPKKSNLYKKLEKNLKENVNFHLTSSDPIFVQTPESLASNYDINDESTNDNQVSSSELELSKPLLEKLWKSEEFSPNTSRNVKDSSNKDALNLNPEQMAYYFKQVTPAFDLLFPQVCPALFTPEGCLLAGCALEHGISSDFPNVLKRIDLPAAFRTYQSCCSGIIIQQTFQKYLNHFKDLVEHTYLFKMLHSIDQICRDQLLYGLEIFDALKQKGLNMQEILEQCIQDSSLPQIVLFVALSHKNYKECFPVFRKIVIDKTYDLKPNVINGLLTRYLDFSDADFDFFESLSLIIITGGVVDMVIPDLLDRLESRLNT